MPSLHRNLVSGSLFNKARLKIVFEANKVIITKNEDFLGKGYLTDGLLVLDIIFAAPNTSSFTAFTYIAESVNLWHGRLGHVNITSIKRLKTMHLINVGNDENCSKCSVCVEAKYVKKTF